MTITIVITYIIINIFVAAFGVHQKNGAYVATSVASLACLAIAVASGLQNGYENLVVFMPYIIAGLFVVLSIIKEDQQTA